MGSSVVASSWTRPVFAASIRSSPASPRPCSSTASAEGVTIEAGEILLVRTGYLGTWVDHPELRVRRRQSGLDFDTIPWLADRDVADVAADNRTVEAIPGPAGHPPAPGQSRRPLRDLGLLVGELFDLDELPTTAPMTGRLSFSSCAAPLPVVNAVGSPPNPLAIK